MFRLFLKYKTLFLSVIISFGFVFLPGFCYIVLGQTTLATWTFPNSSNDAVCDGGIDANLAKTISTVGTSAITFNSNGATTLSANATLWNSGSGTKYWYIDIATTGFYSITVSSAQRGRDNGGALSPRDFRLEYDAGSGWVAVTGGGITVANDFTSGVLNDIALPAACDNLASLKLRWIMTSNTSINGGTVNATGYDRIDDIVIKGNLPYLSITPTNLDFGSVISGSTSSNMTYVLSGKGLAPVAGNITVNAPANFEVSLSSGSGFASAISVPYTGGTMASTTIYARFKPTVKNTSYSGDITNSGGGVTTQNVAVSGNSIISYCTSNGNTSYNTSITYVNFYTLDNVSAKPSGYSDYTSQVTNVVRGNSYNLTVNLNTDGNYTIYARVWIDWNGNGSFNDSGEGFDLGSARNTSDGTTSLCPLSITVPTEAVSGTIRMRVSAQYNSYPTSCNTGFDGEVEDYNVNILSVYYSRGSNPSLLSSWNSLRAGGGASPTGFSSDNQVFVVQPSYPMTVTSVWSVSGTDAKVQVESGASLTANAAISLSSGTTFQLDNGAVYNHNVNSSTIWDGTEILDPGSTVVYGFAGMQNITALNYGNLSVSGGNTKTIQGDITVNGALNLINGNLSLGTGAYNLVLAPGATISGLFDNTHMVICDGTGRLLKQGATATEFVMVFPIGTGAYYTPFEITGFTSTISGTGSLGVRAVAGKAPGPPSASESDLQKYWNVETSNMSEVNANLKLTYINPGEIGTGGNQAGYVPFFYNGSAWSQPAVSSSPGVNPMTVTGATTLSGQWTARKNPTTYYSYRTGNWNEISTWTTDPSGTLQIGTSIPGDNDRVIILSDRTVTLTGDVSQVGIEMTIYAGGILDLAGYRFINTLSALLGQGTLKLASDSFPVASVDIFTDAGGGTTEYYNSDDFTLKPSQIKYNNLTINCSASVATQLSDLTLNGNLHVKAGTFRINDDVSTTRLSLAINGNVTVDNGALITVGKGATNTAIGSTGTGGTAPFLNYYLNFHTVIIKGDFINSGTVKFTNLGYPLFTAFPPTTAGSTSGAASVYFQGDSDNTLTCNGPVTFYNLIVNKGTDQTYKLIINSTNYSNFRLFGANSLAAEGAITSDPLLRKALWIYSGTLVLKGNVIIPSLSEGTTSGADYYIPSKGALVSDGVDVVVLSTSDSYREVNTAYGVSSPDDATIGVTKGGYSALDIFGKLEINNGFLSTRESGGIITSSTASGQFILNGGIIDAKQFLSSTGTASYTQTGGVFILRGRLQRIPSDYSTIANLTDNTEATLGTIRADNGISTGYGSFNLENTGNIYSVSGGTIRIYDVTLNTGGEAFDVKCSSSNINVTGGALEILPMTGTNLSDATNFLINTTAPLYDLTIKRLSSSSTVGLSAPLIVRNDFYLMAGALTTNNNNLAVGGDVTIESGATYTPGTNTTILNGTGNQLFTNNNTTALSLYGFTITKAASDSVTIAGSQSIINVTSAFNLTAGTLFDNGKIINISGNIYNSGIHCGTGAIVLNGTAAQVIDGAGVFQNITLNNSISVTLAANMTVNGILTFSQDVPLNISTYNLLLNAMATINGVSTKRYIQTAGNAGDGGLTRVYSSITPFVFPLGVSTKYTPATIGFTAEPTTYGSVTVAPVNYEHPVTTINGQSLKYYWHVKSSGFTGITPYTITHQFVYASADVVGTETNYVPAIYDATAHAWYYGTTTDINTTTNTFSDWTLPTNSTNFLDADYTAGLSTSFGTPKIFYSYQSGLWSSRSSWSLTSHTVANQPAVAPGANDIVIIGGNDSIYLSNETITDYPDYRTYFILNKAIVNCASLQIEKGAVLDIQNNPGCTFASVLSLPQGNGKIRITTRDPKTNMNGFNDPEAFAYPHGDFSEFSTNNGISEFYTINSTAGTYYVLPSNANSYGTVILTPLGGSNIIMPNIPAVTINGDLICNGSIADAWLAMSWWSQTTNIYGTIVTKTVTVKGDLKVLGGSFIYIYNNYTLQRITIDGDVYVARNAAIDVQTNSYNNAMSIGGSLINNSNYSSNNSSLVRFLNGDYSCDLTFSGDSSSYVTNYASVSTTPYTRFGNVTINKGSSQATTMTWNIGGTLLTPADNWLTLQNGTLIYDRTGDFTISQGTDFTIPVTSGLTLNTTSNVYLSNNAASETVYLNGKLTIKNAGGNVYIGPVGNTSNNADIEYSGSGASGIEVQGGYLYVNGQIRRSVGTTNGILHYKQSNGSVIIYGNNSTLTKAKLEVLNDGSSFTMTGGKLTIVKGGGTTYGDLYLRPTTSLVNGGTIIFSQVPSSGTTIDAEQSYKLDANITLNNITVTGKSAATSRKATVTLMVSPLVLDTLTLSNSNSYLVSNNLNVTISGDLDNSGTYTYGTNTTTFNGSVQKIRGASVTDFYNLMVSSVTSLAVNKSFTINKDLTISSGSLVLSSYQAALLGNLTNRSSFNDDNFTGGISLQGTSQQIISGTGYYDRLILDNSKGAILNNSITLHHNFVLTNGILDINQYQLTLGQSSLISGSSFSSTKMIKSDGVSSSLGVVKFFNSGAQNFTYPIGVSGKYTPAIFAITASTAVRSIKVNPVDAVHPTATDATNALNYYWQIESSGTANITATDTLQYFPDDVSGTESSYVSARLNLATNTWHKTTEGSLTDSVNELKHQIIFNFSSTSYLDGDYTAGGINSLPDEIATYTTTSDGDWSDKSIWVPVGSSPACPEGGPRGCIVIIKNVVNADINHLLSVKTTINGTLRIGSSTYGHDLGTVDGYGTLYLESGNIPAGTYTDFFDCSGNGTLEYGGSGTYTIIASLFNSIPKIKFSGTGSRVLPNKDLTICKSLVINGPALDNSVNNRKLTILGSMERYNTGTFISGSGSSPNATVTFAGTSAQVIGGTTGDFTGTNKFNNLEINNSAGLTIGENGAIEVNNVLLLTNGIIKTSSTSTLTLLSTSVSAVSPDGGSDASFISGPLTKYINNGESFIYPVGKDSKIGHDFTLTGTGGSTSPYTVEFFRPNSTATSIADPLKVSNTLEYWSVSSTSSTTVKVKIGWDSSSDLTPLTTDNGIADMRVAEFISGLWTGLTSATSGGDYNGYVYNINSVSIGTTAILFTTAAVSGTLARAALSSSGVVCGAAGIPVSFTSFDPINLTYTLDYTIDGVAQPTITVTSLPYVLPTPEAGAYVLTGFKYNSGTVKGIVDVTAVNVYANPTTAEAGEAQSLCGLSATILSGNDPTVFSGLWTVVRGGSGSFDNNSQYNTTFTGDNGSSYTLRWTISNYSCSSSDTVVISFPVVASAPGEFTEYSKTVCRGSNGNVYTVTEISGVTYNWTYSGTGHTFTGTGNSVTMAFDESATSGTLSVTTTNSCGTSTAKTFDIIVIGQIWTGASGTDWNTTGNWSCGFLPSATSNIQIPDVANKPVLASGSSGYVNNITIDNGSSLTVLGEIQVSGTITNNGTFDVTAGTIELNGTSAQSVGPNVFSNYTVRNLTINNSSGVTLLDTVKVTDVVLASVGNLASNGYLILRSTDSGTALIDGSGSGTVSGNVTMQRYLPSGFGYKYFSSPFQAAKVKAFSDDMNLISSSTAFYKFDENRIVSGIPASGWVNYKDTSKILYPLAGYAVNFGSNSAENTVDITGVVNNGGLSVTLYNNDQKYTKGFNLVGNPYPSPIDWDAASGWTRTNVDGAIYLFKASDSDQYYGSYCTYVGGGGGIATDGSAGANIIPSMQGFFVHVADGGYPVTATFAMNNSVRITDKTHAFAKSLSNETKGSPDPIIRINASFQDYPALNDPAVIYYDYDATDGFDSNLDAIKLYNSNTKVPNLYSVTPDDKKLAISSLPPDTEINNIPLGLKTSRKGNVVFTISDIDASLTTSGIYLTDKVEGVEQDMSDGKTYNVYLESGEYLDRFYLNCKSSGISTETEEIDSDNDMFKIYSSKGKIYAEIFNLAGKDGTLTIYDILGQKLFIEKIYQKGYYEFSPGLKSGIYIVNFSSGKIVGSKKLFIENR